MRYFISHPSAGDWRLDEPRFIQEVRLKWPAVRLATVAGGQAARIEWELDMSGGLLVGEVLQDWAGITFEGDLDDVAEFALWFRSFGPENNGLVLYDEGYSADVPLSGSLTITQIVEAFESAP